MDDLETERAAALEALKALLAFPHDPTDIRQAVNRAAPVFERLEKAYPHDFLGDFLLYSPVAPSFEVMIPEILLRERLWREGGWPRVRERIAEGLNRLKDDLHQSPDVRTMAVEGLAALAEDED